MKIRQITARLGEIAQQGNMLVPARFYLPARSMEQAHKDKSLQQLMGVAHLPGILQYALAMPDIHWGYGFPIGGVAAVDAVDGAVSPGGVGYDINCGVRVVATEIAAGEARAERLAIVRELYRTIPVGVGASNALPTLSSKELRRVLTDGASWAVNQGFAASEADQDACEEGGALAGADPGALSARALERGASQVGTLGSGNHFLELDEVEEVFDLDVAQAFGLWQGQSVIMIHSGSRGLGHQVCDDALGQLTRQMASYGKQYARIPDRQLACAPIGSAAGRQYLASMRAAANFAWANRQVMTGLAVEAMGKALGVGPASLGARLVYDVCHNIAKTEAHRLGGEVRQVLVHRKGATRAFGPDDDRVPQRYRKYGQPVIVPGDMGRCSYVLVGANKAMRDTFGSACHGAGRVLSRHQALKRARGRRIDEELRDKGIEVMAKARRTLAEEMSEAYKDVDDVVDVLVEEGIVGKVARLRPFGVVKG